jgi:hypothetical protein
MVDEVRAPTLERSTYVLFSSITMAVLFVMWQPLGLTIWSVQSLPARLAL